jgi:hypothetical protein
VYISELTLPSKHLIVNECTPPLLDAATGGITEVMTDGNPCCLVVSPSLGKVAYEFSDRPGFSVYDLESDTTVDFPEGSYVPHLAGQNRT